MDRAAIIKMLDSLEKQWGSMVTSNCYLNTVKMSNTTFVDRLIKAIGLQETALWLLGSWRFDAGWKFVSLVKFFMESGKQVITGNAYMDGQVEALIIDLNKANGKMPYDEIECIE